MKTAVTVEKKDIERIGHTAYSKNGMLNIICDGDTYGVEGILLRSILSCINPEYKIVQEGDFRYNSGELDWEFPRMALRGILRPNETQTLHQEPGALQAVGTSWP